MLSANTHFHIIPGLDIGVMELHGGHALVSQI